MATAFRHPIPTEARWRRKLQVSVCARRHGLTVSATRLLCAGAPDAELLRRLRACASVFARLAIASRLGVRASALYDEAVTAYAAAGFPGEEHRHHQGGACGYRTRDWLAHPASEETVRPRQAFAWNPTVTGAKIEETIVATADGPRLLTATPDWPALVLDEVPAPFALPGALELG